MTEPTPTGWTDHDASDPGITLLELVVYAIGALGIAIATAVFMRTRRDSCEACRSWRARAGSDLRPAIEDSSAQALLTR